jgi:hypothetical protein
MRPSGSNRRQIEAVTQEFLSLEDELDLFDRTVAGVHFWQRVRFRVHRDILQRCGIIGQARTRTHIGISAAASTLEGAFGGVVHHNPFILDPKQLLFFSTGRRKKGPDGTWWDIYCDPVIDALKHSYVLVEKPYQGSHRQPAHTKNIKYLDVVTFLAAVNKRSPRARFRVPSEGDTLIREIERRLEAAFASQVPLKRKIERALLAREVFLPAYERMLARADPELVFLVCSYGRHDLIEACQKLGITTVELQHGVMHPSHMGYAFPGDGRPGLFPDHFFAFGRFWTEQVDLPIPPERIHCVGYPYFEAERRRFKGVAKRQQILFISQGTVGYQLSRMAVELSRMMDHDWRIIYKLHPKETGGWREEYPWLTRARGVDVLSEQVPLYRLFAESRIQVGVNSTALFEGLGFGLRTYLAQLHGVGHMRPLQESGLAHVVRDAEDLKAKIDAQVSEACVSVEDFFVGGSLERIRDITATILDPRPE